MKKKLTYIFLIAMVIFLLVPMKAFADMGPKPSVVLNFKGLEGEKYYVTLLSETDSTGPYSILTNESYSAKYSEGHKDYDIWKTFISYDDPDGYYFLQYFQDCSNTSEFAWTYYPPYKFKILLYFPDKNTFVESSETYERYAFDSYYSVDARNLDIQAQSMITGGFEVSTAYDFSWEILSLIVRIIATILIEVLIALLFGFTSKKQIMFIAITNIITQSILNILLNVFNYSYGNMAFVLNYVWMEIVVLVIEAYLYSSYLNKYTTNALAKKSKCVIYALIANIFSFAGGLVIAFLIPGIF